MRILLITTLLSLFFMGESLAGDVQIVDVRVTQRGEAWAFAVTLKHADSGWEHYADAWRVVTAEGTELGTRTLFHPHEDEQPFTRSLEGVVIPDPTEPVFIEAHDTVHGWAKRRFKIKLHAH